MKNRQFAIVGLSLGLLLAMPQLASAGPRALTTCLTIYLPGSYLVARSFTVTQPNCFVIQTDDVKLDFDGQTLTGQNGTNGGTQSAVTDNGIRRNSIEITNGGITNFRRAIELGACSNCKVTNMRIHTNGDGINVGTDANVSGNIVTNSDDDGIRVGRESIVDGNISNDNTSDGIRAVKHSVVRGNITQNNDGTGLELQCPSLALENVSLQNGINSTNDGGCTLDDNIGF